MHVILQAQLGVSVSSLLTRANNSLRFKDVTTGNVNFIMSRPDGVTTKFVRVTVDPTGSRVISAGHMRASQVVTRISNGTLKPF